MVFKSSGFWKFELSPMPISLYLLVSSADNLCNQFGPRSSRSSPTKCLLVFLKECEKNDFEKYQQMTEVGKNISTVKSV